MVNRRISADLKACALRLWNSGWDEQDICDALQVSRSSIYQWRRIFAEFGTVNKPPSPLCGRLKTITSAVLNSIQQLYRSDSATFLDELRWWLAVNHDIAISKTALQRTLQTAGLSRKLLRKIARERNKLLREEWRDDIRSHFSGTAELQHVFVRGVRYSLIAALSKRGYIAARVVEGSFNAFDFFDFIIEDLLPQMNPWPDARSIIVLDDCRIHHNRALKNAVRAAGRQMMT
ncbi:hypothetical protein WOLCODRAFT_80230 [Wolfiporia cocos MD-104 SS10]|uniref:Tc1-like transposase DDE domain-containing protein n=1 Tax=Wolfiporia cocos (strain MD-104) TaxID=742152 RepID=A0A2H3IZS0_WOLCO|nr:hypothetical protein WOLCODRAFT_80230 [Wolfiporia cocos MD-104 SS10]